MNSIDRLNIIAPLVARSDEENAALHELMDIATNGYKSDKTELDNANLQLDRVTANNVALTAQLDEKDATIATLTTALEDNNIALPADTPVEAVPE